MHDIFQTSDDSHNSLFNKKQHFINDETFPQWNAGGYYFWTAGCSKQTEHRMCLFCHHLVWARKEYK